jgi:hypothetical protein
MTQKIIKVLSAVMLLGITILPVKAIAQDGWDEADEAMDTPLDGGLSVLLAGGAAYILRAGKKKQPQK